MSITTEKQRITQQCSPSHSWLRCVALFVMALSGLGVGLWRSHLLEDASGLALLLFSSITLPMVGLAGLAVWVSQHLSGLPAKSKTEPSGQSSKQSGDGLASKSKTRKAAAKVAAIAVMIGIGLLAILPIVALVKVSVVESMVKQQSEESVHFGSERFAKAFAQQYKRCLDEQR